MDDRHLSGLLSPRCNERQRCRPNRGVTADFHPIDVTRCGGALLRAHRQQDDLPRNQFCTDWRLVGLVLKLHHEPARQLLHRGHRMLVLLCCAGLSAAPGRKLVGLFLFGDMRLKTGNLRNLSRSL